jgi:hypothetical protein
MLELFNLLKWVLLDRLPVEEIAWGRGNALRQQLPSLSLCPGARFAAGNVSRAKGR